MARRPMGPQPVTSTVLPATSSASTVSIAFPSGFMPKNARQRQPSLSPQIPVIHVHIRATYRGGPQTDQNLMRAAAGDVHTGDSNAPLRVCLHDGKHRVCGHSAVLSLLVAQ